MNMKRVVLESPFAGNVVRNVAYAKLCVRDILLRGEAPIASHLLFTQPGVLDDNNLEQRKLGMEAGFAWNKMAELVAVYDDFGISNGMKQGIEIARNCHIKFEHRQLPVYLIEELKSKYPD
jgi:hypothetical protein